MKLNGFVFDIEADGLYLQSRKVWYIRLTSLDKTRTTSIYPFRDPQAKEKFCEWLGSFEEGCIVAGHNILSYDLWVIWKLLGVVPRVGKGGDWLNGKSVVFIDTLVLSMYLNPDNQKHSLGFLASGSENEKMDYRNAWDSRLFK